MTTTIDPSIAYIQAVQAWRDEQEASLRAEDGWLTVVGLFWLHDGVNTVGSSPDSDVVLPSRLPPHLGLITLHDGETQWRLTDEKFSVLVDGERRREAVLHHDARHPTLIQVGGVTFFVIRRGERLAVRVRDTESEARRTFVGRQWFAVDPSYRVSARLERHASSRTIEVETVLGTTVQYNSPGTVTFELAGAPYTLQAFEGATDSELWFVFRDATSGHSTYGASRFLYAHILEDGMVDLDFNRAKSPPCAFTPYATCPLPPRENILSIPIAAGEKHIG